MRQGILYDLLGRFHHRDMRDATVAQFMKRYHVDSRQAQRVEAPARLPPASCPSTRGPIPNTRCICCPGGVSVDWPVRRVLGLSQALGLYPEPRRHARLLQDGTGAPVLLVSAHRGNMEKMKGQITDSLDLAMVMVLLLAVQLHRSRSDAAPAPDGGPLRRQEV